jgi:tetraprenyl-beta-curcumene synthase
MMREVRSAATRVAMSAPRLSMLAGGGAETAYDLIRFLRNVVPRASRALELIRARAEAIPDERLRVQALSSIDGKAYHVAGGCILATFLSRPAAEHYIEIVAPLETIYDYLDNLCDRHPGVSASAYPVLHRAIFDALDPTARAVGYYELGPVGDDGDYLVALVRRTQRSLRRLSDYRLLLPLFHEAAKLYGEMQSYVHLPPGEREAACERWFAGHRSRYGDLQWQEFACAAGSQFHVYAPLFMLFDSSYGDIAASYDAYFPAVSALHVLLDSFIDQQEDRENGDLNFVAAYAGRDEFFERAAVLARRAVAGFSKLPDSHRHRFVLRTMALFYLTHPKVYAQGLDHDAQRLLSIVDDALEG